MKEIKFRMYDIQNDNMIYYTLRELTEAALAAEFVYHFVPDNIYELIDIIDCNNLDFPQMQFTGKSCIDNIDIYEGDIIYKEICAPDDPAYGSYGSTGVVREDPHNMGWYVDAIDGDGDDFYDHLGMNFDFNEIKVIGNIHENRELLE